MRLLDTAPVNRLLVPFAIGIIIHNSLPNHSHSLWYILLGSVGLLCITTIFPIWWKWKFSLINGSILLLIVTLLGARYATWRDHRRSPHWIGHMYTQKENYLVRFRKEVSPTRNGWRSTADLIARQEGSRVIPVSGGIFLYTKNDSIFQNAVPGREAWIQTRLKPIKNKAGATFDYERYCIQKKITHQGYLSTPTAIEFAEPAEWNFASMLHHIRMQVKNIIYENIPDSVNAGLASALFIGWKGGLDPELKQQYTQTGTIHIIAISGLHISLVFEILWKLLFPLLFLRGGQTLRTLITLSCVWVFCFLAGGEASVLRAGIMFTAVHVGRWMERPIGGMQALGLSMLSLLLADPDWLFDPGFQLSHSAVMGILVLQPRFTSVITLKNPILRSIWESSSLTIAATIGTFPFTGYYFHQFPGLFLPANLIAVPLSSLVLIGLFLLIPSASSSILSIPISVCIDQLLDAINTWIERLNRIPGMVWKW